MDMKKTILVIEDDETISEVVKIILEEQGFDVIQDLKGDFFHTHLSHEIIPNLVLIDLLLPGISGTEIVKEIRRKPAYMSIPVVMMSANSPSELAETAKHSGADAFITKPFNIEDLSKLILKLAN